MNREQVANIVAHFGISPEWVDNFHRLLRGRCKKSDREFIRMTVRCERFAAAVNMIAECLTPDWVLPFFPNKAAAVATARRIAGYACRNAA